MAYTIYRLPGQSGTSHWHFADPVSGVHLSNELSRGDGFSTELQLTDGLRDEDASWVLPWEDTMRIIRDNKYKKFKLQRESWCISTHEKLSFKYKAPSDFVRDFSGKYTWKYNKSKKQYLLTKKGKSSRVFAMLDLNSDFSNGAWGKFYIYNKCYGSGPLIELASEELDKLICLSIIAMLSFQELEPWEHQKDKKTSEEAEKGAQTDGVMDFGCECPCFAENLMCKATAQKSNDEERKALIMGLN